MKKQKQLNKLFIHVKTESVDDFFARGKSIAKQLDKKEKLIPHRVISFEDPEELAKFLTKTKRALVAAIRKQPRSITDLAKALNRSRSAIDKDVQMLESIGLVESEYIANPGHGKHRVVKITHSNPIRLYVETSI